MNIRTFSLFFFTFIIFSCVDKKQKTQNEKITPSAIISEDTTSNLVFEEMIKEYESKDRDEWQHPEAILDFIGNLNGKTVADIGAGTGYFSFKLAQMADTVFAIDIDQRFLDYIEKRKESLRYGLGENVITVLTTPDNPGIFPRKVDHVLLVNTYSYLSNRINYLKKIKQILKNNGSLTIVDFKDKNTPIGPPNNLKVSSKSAVQELEQAGFYYFRTDTLSLPYQYIINAY